jgi:hypothetical protein
MGNTSSAAFLGDRVPFRTRVVLRWVKGPLWDHAVLIPLMLWVLLILVNVLPTPFVAIAPESRRAILQTFATLTGTMTGLTLTSVSIMINLVRTPLSAIDKLLPSADKRRVGGVFLAALPNLLGAFLASLVALALEPGAIALASKSPPALPWFPILIVLWFTAASLLSIARIVWVLRKLLRLAD